MPTVIIRTRLCSLLAAVAVAGVAAPAGAHDQAIDLHAAMVGKLDGACRVDPERLARLQPRMVVIHAVVDQTSLPSGWARARVLRPLLGGVKTGALLPVAHRGALGVHLVQDQQYLISMYRYQNVYIVDRALPCQAQA